MSRPRQFEPDEVVDRSMREFWAKGYRDTSVGDLVAATGVRPGSLYGAFEGGKRQIFIEALKLYSALVVPQKLGALERPRASLGELRAYFDGLVSDLMSPEGRVGCLMVNTTVELAAEDSEIAGLTRAHMARLERTAERALRTARDRGEIPAEIDPAAKATQLMATGMGLMVVGKTNPGSEVLQTIVDTAFADLR
ncbi:MAG TPA: TetR/AcrR family transcriptional regulator [Solirubrobacteraceae bacterium]|jgi:TetR/AcrR family transcriptional repressor of nem operon